MSFVPFCAKAACGVVTDRGYCDLHRRTEGAEPMIKSWLHVPAIGDREIAIVNSPVAVVEAPEREVISPSHIQRMWKDDVAEWDLDLTI